MPSDRTDVPEVSKTPPPRARFGGGVVFALVFLTIALSILGVVLTANNQQNLHRLLARLDIDWPIGASEQAQRAPPALKGKRLESVAVRIPAHFMAMPEVDVPGSFVREMRNLGPAFCRAFDEAGISNPGWAQSPMDRRTFECLSEELLGQADTDGDGEADAPVASFFFIAKGDPEGEITSIRMKLVAPPGAEGTQARRKLENAVQVLIETTGWSDLADLDASVRQLADYEHLRFGMSYSFKREFTNGDRFNLIVLPTNKDPASRRARAYFERSTWLPTAPAVPLDWPRMELAVVTEP